MNIFRYNFIIKKVSKNAFFSPMKNEEGDEGNEYEEWRMKKLRIIKYKFLEKKWKILVPHFLKKPKNCSVCSAEVAVALQDYIPLLWCCRQLKVDKRFKQLLNW